MTSTFGTQRTDALTLHNNGVRTKIKSLSAVRVFDDTKTWWYANDSHTAESHGRYQVGWSGVNVPKTGTQIRVERVRDGGKYIDVRIRPVN